MWLVGYLVLELTTWTSFMQSHGGGALVAQSNSADPT